MYSSKDFVGQVFQMEEDEVVIKYMKTSGSSFIWSELKTSDGPQEMIFVYF